jgi:hypothetical protein
MWVSSILGSWCDTNNSSSDFNGCYSFLQMNLEARVQFHQCSTGSFYASSLKPILLAHGVERKSCAYFLTMRIDKVGHIFDGETEWRLLMLKNDYQHIYTLHHNVGEIDLMGQFHQPNSKRHKCT